MFAGVKERAVVLVGSSPRLAGDVERLRGLNDNFRIICANSALKFLLKHGVRPHYTICLDSDRIDIPQHLDCDNEGITLLASSVVCHEALDLWKGPILFMPYYSVSKDLKPQLRRRLGRKIDSGGNSITQALVLSTLIWGCQTVIFVANEYCFDESYYADKEAAKQEKLETLYPVIDVLGHKRWTLPALYVYAIWTEKVCNDLSPPAFFMDTSFGLLGKDAKGIHVMEIAEAIKRTNWAFEVKQRLNNASSDDEKAQIVKEISPPDDQSEVLRYDMQVQRPRLLQLARS